MNLVTIDFETYYDQQYSLSKITTEEYIRSDMFEFIGVSIKIGTAPAEWFTGLKVVRQALVAIDWATSAALCHPVPLMGLS